MKRIGVSRGIAVTVGCVGLVLGAPAGVAAASCGGSGPPSPNPGSERNGFYGVAATSACNAWAVGYYENVGGHSRPLVERWNGKAWKVQKSAEPSKGDTMLLGVAALSASDAWAVGSVPHPQGVMVEHWNGTAWTVQPTSPLDGDALRRRRGLPERRLGGGRGLQRHRPADAGRALERQGLEDAARAPARAV